jgi:hypothetical protein
MAPNVFSNGAALFRVIEDAPMAHLKEFLCQTDENFEAAAKVTETALQVKLDDENLRAILLKHLNKLAKEELAPVEVECLRAMGLTEAKGPSALQEIAERNLHNEAFEEFEAQPGDLAKALWAHARHRKIFDDAVSYKNIRSWRNAGRLFAAFSVDRDPEAQRFSASEIDTEKLGTAIGRRLKSSQKLSFSVIELPKVPEYPPSILVIVRFAGQQTSVATHGKDGERRLIYFLPQDEAVLIYTPPLERIEVAATRAAVRRAVADCFAVETLGHDLSSRPLVAASYDTSRFLKTVELALPDVPGFTVLSAKLTELELRIADWSTKLGVKVSAKLNMEDVVGRYLTPGKVLRLALGVSKALLQIRFQGQNDAKEQILEIAISDGNSCSLNSERDPGRREFGRRVLEAWSIMRVFRDLTEDEVGAFIPIMAELWELDERVQKGTFFTSRGIKTDLLERASLIKRKEVEPVVMEDDDPEVEGPSAVDRTVFSLDLDWVQERLIAAVKSILDTVVPDDASRPAIFVGVTKVDEIEVPCYLARGLGDIGTFSRIDEFLRARSVLGPGIVFTGTVVGPRLVGSNVIVPLSAVWSAEPHISIDRDTLDIAFRAGRSLALGSGTLELVVEDGGEAARLLVPGRPPLDLIGEPSVQAFRLLVAAAKRGAPPVKAGDLIAGSSSTGFQQMIGSTRWPIVEAYVEQVLPRRWNLKGY